MKHFLVHLLVIALMFPSMSYAAFWDFTSNQEVSDTNLIENSGFEQSTARWTKTGSSTLSVTTSQPYEGANSGVWTAGAASDTLSTKAVDIPAGWASESCLAQIKYKWTGTLGELLFKVQNGTSTDLVTPVTIPPSVSGKWSTIQAGFTCPSSGTASIKLESTAASTAITLDKSWLGQDFRIGTGAIDLNSPAGLIMAWPHDTIPDGWLEADGSAVGREAYPDLFANIGTTYGVGDGSTTFNLPDYRGQFLRGQDNTAGTDPDAGSRTDRGDGTTGDNVGTKQGFATAEGNLDIDGAISINRSTMNTTNHDHNQGSLYARVGMQQGQGFIDKVGTTFTAETLLGSPGVGTVNGSFGGKNGAVVSGNTGTDGGTQSLTVSNGTIDVTSVDTETRPTNVGVKWIIKHTNSGTQNVVTVDSIKSPLKAGMVMAWPNDVLPTGWLEADGAAISRATYSDLFAEIGVKYGNGDGSTTFNLPDYRGQFLRGTDGGAGTDPDAGSRTDRGDGTTGDNVGTKQVDATAENNMNIDGTPTINRSTMNTTNHDHNQGTLVARFGADGTDITWVSVSGSFTGNANLATSGSAPGSGSSLQSTDVVGNTGTDGGTQSLTVAKGTLDVVSTDTETRPTNVGVKWIIKTTTDVLNVAVAFPEATATVAGGVTYTDSVCDETVDICSGTYTPTVSGETDCTSVDVASYRHHFMKIGNIVHIQGGASCIVGNINTTSDFNLSLPFGNGPTTNIQGTGVSNWGQEASGATQAAGKAEAVATGTDFRIYGRKFYFAGVNRIFYSYTYEIQ